MTIATLTIELHAAQQAFRRSGALYRGFVGGRGSGKSYVGAYDLIRRAEPGRLYGVYAPTYGMLKDATLRSFLQTAQHLRFLSDMRYGDLRATLGNGAEVLFRSVDDPERARGPNLSGAWLDEASLMQRAAYDIIIAALRERGASGWLSATFTPKGRNHWTYEVFGLGAPNTALFHATTRENPFLPREFYDNVRQQYAGQYARQELDGEFIDLIGGIVQRDWFGSTVEAAPREGRRVRYWDFAATEKGARSGDPDFTAGTLMAAHEGQYWVEHVVHGRYGPGALERVVRQTAEADGRAVQVWLEREPGAGSKLFNASLIRTLAGWTVREDPVSGDKLTRAMPFLGQAEAGNVHLVRGAWVQDWLDEMVAFGSGAHDDRVDSAAGAFRALAVSGWSRGPAGA